MKKWFVKSVSYYKEEPTGSAMYCEVLKCSDLEDAKSKLSDIIEDDWTTLVEDEDGREVSLADVPGYGQDGGRYSDAVYDRDGMFAWAENDMHFYKAEVFSMDIK